MAPATKTTLKRLEASVSAFNTRYADSNQWGEDRWQRSLYPALMQPTTYCALLNRYAMTETEGKAIISNSGDIELRLVDLPDSNQSHSAHKGRTICFEQVVSKSGLEHESMGSKTGTTQPFPIPKPANSSVTKLYTHWNMDAASVLAAQMLDVRPGDRVLDMCAAPGGKSVVLAQKLFPQLHTEPSVLHVEDEIKRSSLVVNELDTSRYKRLMSNMKSYLPGSLFPTPEDPQAPVRILNKDLSTKSSASSLPYGVGAYDKVLIDAPCSSERHLIHAYEKAKAAGQVAEEMLNWKASHVTTLTKTQAGLLQTALKAVKVGGRIVYATCALGLEENDGIIEKVLNNIKAERKRAKRDGQSVETWEINLQLGSEGSSFEANDSLLQRMTERTKYGRIALPDHAGWGPLYFSVLIKVEKVKKTKSKTKPTTLSEAMEAGTEQIHTDDHDEVREDDP